MIISFILTTFPFDSRVILWGETRVLFYILYFLNIVPWHLFEILSKKEREEHLEKGGCFILGGGGHLLRNNQPVLIPLYLKLAKLYTKWQ